MLSRMTSRFAVRASRSLAAGPVRFNSTSLQDLATADDAWRASCYSGTEYTIKDTDSVYDAVQKLAGFNIGCLITVDEDGNMTGVVSERDYVCKIALLGRTSKDTQVKQISTKAPNLVTAKPTDSVEDCMARMLTKDIRHLPLVGEDGRVMGMISIKDLVKTLVREKEKTIKVLSDLSLGKGAHFGID